MLLLIVTALALTVVGVICWGLMCGDLERGRIVHAFYELLAAAACGMVVAHLIRVIATY